jgi:hypothetical protein
MARNRRILHMPMEWKNESIIIFQYVLVTSAGCRTRIQTVQTTAQNV